MNLLPKLREELLRGQTYPTGQVRFYASNKFVMTLMDCISADAEATRQLLYQVLNEREKIRGTK